MLCEHCKLIPEPNIYYMTAGGLFRDDGSLRRRSIENNMHLVSQDNFNQVISQSENRFRFILEIRKVKQLQTLTDILSCMQSQLAF